MMSRGGIMKMRLNKRSIWQAACLLAMVLLMPLMQAQAAIDGVTGNTFNLTAKADYIITPDSNSILMWGYALNNGTMQYPGPTMIVNQGDTVTINLTNNAAMPQNVSIIFPGQTDVTATGGAIGIMTREAVPGGGVVTYTFVAAEPGTYTYYSGTSPELQIEMGLVGVIIVRPAGYNAVTNRIAYNSADTAYDYEYLFFISEIDPRIHAAVATGNRTADNAAFFPVYWFLNGRAAPDTMLDAFVPWLPTQPYNCMPRTRPGDKLLLRLVGGGRDMHPYHEHGNHTRTIAKDGRILKGPANEDLSSLDFTTTVIPGSTRDALFEWTGADIGWDVYGAIDTACIDTGAVLGSIANDGLDDNTGLPCHDTTCTDVSPADGFDDATKEYCSDHGKPFPVTLPSQQAIMNGQFYSGSPFLGTMGSLPPGEGGFNPNSGFLFMWHSHNEKEITNNDIFPGGMLTMMIIEPPSVLLSKP